MKPAVVPAVDLVRHSQAIGVKRIKLHGSKGPWYIRIRAVDSLSRPLLLILNSLPSQVQHDQAGHHLRPDDAAAERPRGRRAADSQDFCGLRAVLQRRLSARRLTASR